MTDLLSVSPLTCKVNIQPSLVRRADYLKIQNDDLVAIANLKELLENEPLDDKVQSVISEFLGVWSNIDSSLCGLLQVIPDSEEQLKEGDVDMLFYPHLIDLKNVYEENK